MKHFFTLMLMTVFAGVAQAGVATPSASQDRERTLREYTDLVETQRHATELRSEKPNVADLEQQRRLLNYYRMLESQQPPSLDQAHELKREMDAVQHHLGPQGNDEDGEEGSEID